MLIIQLTINLYGNQFCVHDLINIIKDPVKIIAFHEPTDINPLIKQKYDFGHIAIQHPTQLGINYQFNEYYLWHINFIENYYISFQINGVEEINVFIKVYYSKECNIEIFDNQLIKRLAEYNVSIPLSAHKMTNEQIKIFLISNGYSPLMIEQLFKYE